MWRIEMLGGLRVVRDDRVIERFPTQRTAALLAYLATFPHRAHSREVLAELFWPDRELESQRHSLRLALSRLRQLFGEDHPFDTTRLAVRLRPDAYVTDVAEFEAAAARGDSRIAQRLYVGSFLPGFYDEWVQIEQDRLIHLYESLDPNSRSLPETLPTTSKSLVGREGAVQEVRALLDRHPWVTLTGPGGVGKTRLAVEIAAGFARAVMVSLVDLSQAHHVPDEVRRVLQVPTPAPGLSVSELVRRELQELAPLLLFLDNAEHLDAGPLAQFLADLSTVPHVRLLVTSRQPIGSPVEMAFTVVALEPEHASALFCDRALRLRPEFAPDPTALSNLVDRFGGLPLAVELAAARMGVYGLGELEAMDWTSRDDFGQFVGVAVRHRSLDSVLRTSLDLLNPETRAVFAKLAVFRGGFDAEGAEMVAGASRSTLETLRNLGLIVPEALPKSDTGEAPRFRIPEPLRDVAIPESEDGPRKHALYFADWIAANRADELPKPPYEFGLRIRLQDREAANIRVALDTCCQSDRTEDRATGLRIVAAFWTHWYVRGQGLEIENWVNRLREGVGQTVDPMTQAPAQLVFGLALRERGERQEWLRHIESAFACLSCGPRDRNLAFAHHLRGFAYADFGRAEEAEAAYQDAEEIWKEIGDWRNYSVTRHNRGLLALDHGRLADAESLVSEALDWFRQHQSTYQGIGNATLAGIRMALRNLKGASEAYDEARQMYQKLGYVRGEAENDRDHAICLWRLGRAEAAKRAVESALAAYRRIGDRHGEATALVALAIVTGEDWHRDEARLLVQRFQLPASGPFLGDL